MQAQSANALRGSIAHNMRPTNVRVRMTSHASLRTTSPVRDPTAVPSCDPMRDFIAHYQSMPPVAAMQVSVTGYDGKCLRLHAPLALHVNDKGSAFGGSLVSLMTLASWGLVTLRLAEAGMDAEVYVADSEVRYLAPLLDDLEAEAQLADDESWETFVATLRQRGRARTTLVCRVALPDGRLATTFRARYAAIARR